MSNGIFKSLLNRLNSVFNKDPKILTAFRIKPPAQCRMLVKDRRLTITAVNTTISLVDIAFAHPYDAQKNITIKQVFDLLAAKFGFTLDNLNQSLSALGAIALIEGDYILTPDTMNNVPAATSLLWAMFRPLAYVLEQAKDDIDKAIQQLGFVTAEGDFLDYWGTFFDIPRYSTFSSETTTTLTQLVMPGANATIKVGNTLGIQAGSYILLGSGTANFERVFVLSVIDSVTISANIVNKHDPGEPVAVENGIHNVEPDYEYSVRLLWETIKPRINNKAIEELLFRGTGYDTKVIDLSSKILLADGYPLPTDKSSAARFSDENMTGDGGLTSGSLGFPEDTARYSLGERYDYGSIGVFVNVPIVNAFYKYTTEQIQDIVERHRAGGTTPWFTVNQVANETYALINEVVVQLQADIVQDYPEDRAMMFGFDDFQFYGDHWTPDNIAKMPWHQDNLEKPSLSDNIVTQSRSVDVPAVYNANNETVFISGQLADGYYGSFNRNVLNADTTSSSDDFQFRNIPVQYLVTPETTVFVDDPVNLNYPRFSDEYITPRVLEEFDSDILTQSISSVASFNISFASRSGNVTSANIGVHTFVVGQRIVVTGATDTTFNGNFVITAVTSNTIIYTNSGPNNTINNGTASTDISIFAGLPSLTNVAPSSDTVFSVPLRISAPTSITGVKFNSINLTQANIRSVPMVIRNLETPFGENWNTNFSTTRNWIIPLQDTQGNVYYTTIQWQYKTTPPVPALRISNPTSSVTSDKVQIQSGDTINITWVATNSNGVITLRRETIATGVLVDLPVSPSGTAQFSAGNAVTQNTRFHLIVNGNNGQTAEAICTITVVAARTNATPPVITMTAQPDVVELCNTNKTSISYSVDFKSIQTETVTVLFPVNVSQINLSPANSDPVGTTILAPKEVSPGVFQPRLITVSRASDGLPIPGAWTGLETTQATFIPIDPTLVQGKNVTITYDVNYGGSFLKFQDSIVPLPNGGNVFQVSQTATVTLPPPPPSTPSQYVVNYSVTADNYATVPVTSTIPVYVQTIQKGVGAFVVNSIVPSTLTEAIGPTVNQTVPVVLTGTGFSSKMKVQLLQRFLDPVSGALLQQLVEADIMSVDWQNGIATFIAPRLQFGIYPVIVSNLDCLGNTIGVDTSKKLTYARSTFRDAPIIMNLNPSTVCLVPAFTSKQIEVTGNFFRPGAKVYIVTSIGPVAKTTNVINQNQLFFTMDVAVAGSYNIIVENTDTSAGSTKNQPLIVMANNTLPVISQFGYVAPTATSGCVYYGTPFVLHWACNNASSVAFTSNDINVQTLLQPPTSTNWPSAGSLSVPIFNKGTIITMVATNDCGNSASSNITINDLACDRTLSINIVPTPILINDRLAYKLHTHRLALNESINIKSDIDISDETALKYTLVDANDNPIDFTLATQGVNSQAVTLVDRYITANKNGYTRVKAYWNGFQAVSPIYVQVPMPIGLTVTPTPIIFSNIGQVFQLVVVVTYSDGTIKTVTANSNTRYYDYDSRVCSVGLTGNIITNSLGTTYIHCSYFDSFDPTVVVYATAQVGLPDECVGFERLFVSPSYAIAGNIVPVPVAAQVTGVNPSNVTVMPDSSGNFNFSYQGVNAGVDTVVASTVSPVVRNSNAVKVLWINPIKTISCSGVTGLFYSADNSGVFNTNGQNALFSQTFNSLSFNDALLGENLNVGVPVVNAVLDVNGNKTGDIPVTGNTYQAGVGLLNAFNAVLIGNFVIKNSGDYTFSITSDDGFVVGMDAGAIRVGGSYVGAPTSGRTVYSNLPVVGANNTAHGPITVSIVVNFPQPGVYAFEFDWAQGFAPGGTTTFSVWVNGSPIVPITLPAIPINVVPAVAQGIVTLTPAPFGPIGPYIVGGTANFNGTAMGIVQKAGQFTLNVIADNVRSATVNGIAALSGGELQPLFDYSSNDVLTTSKAYKVNIANNSGSITAVATANLITFPAATIDKFTMYDASISGSPEQPFALNVQYGSPVGLLWKTSNAVLVTLSAPTPTDLVLTTVRVMEGAGSQYDAPLADTTYTLRAYSVDGSYVQQQITVTVQNYKYFTHDWAFGPWYLPGNYWRLWKGHLFGASSPDMIHAGQTSTISLNAWDQNYVFDFWDDYLSPIGGWPSFGPGSFDDRVWQRYTALQEIADVSISTDGSRPSVSAALVHYTQNLAQNDSVAVAPSTNTLYQFSLTGTWLWWFWDDWAFVRSAGSLTFNAGLWSLPYARVFRNIWKYGFYSFVNVDQGPKFVSLVATPNSVNAGSPVIISYKITGASSVTANFAQNEPIPLTSGSFTVLPDKTTDYVITATSPTGLVNTATVHVDVTPQVLFAPCAVMPLPRVTSIAMDGLNSLAQGLKIDEEANIHVLEIFGNHFLGDRNPTPEIQGAVKVLLIHQSGNANTALDILELSAVANTYIRCKIGTHPQTLAGGYTVYVMNDNGISSDKGIKQSFEVATTIPQFVMNKPISGHSGDSTTLYVDDYNPTRDAGLVILVGATVVSPTSIGSVLSNTDFVTQMYNQVLGRAPDVNGLNSWINQLEIGSITRVGLMNAFLGSAEYINSGRNVSVGVGTPITVPITSSQAIAVGLRTNNGISATQIEFIPVGAPPPPPVIVNSCCTITGLSQTSGYPGDVVQIIGTNFTINTKVYLGSGTNRAVTPTFVNSSTLQFAVPSFPASVIVSVIVQEGTCSDSYAGFMVFQPDVTPVDPGILPTRNPGGVNFPGTTVSTTTFGATNPTNLLGSSVPPTTVQTTSGTALTQSTYVAPTPVTATIQTTTINNVVVSSPASATITQVSIADVRASLLEQV